MPDVSGILRKLKAAQPDRVVDRIYDYDENWVLAKAPTAMNQREFNAMFLVSKVGSAVKPFVPFKDADKYLAAIRKQPIYEGGE